MRHRKKRLSRSLKIVSAWLSVAAVVTGLGALAAGAGAAPERQGQAAAGKADTAVSRRNTLVLAQFRPPTARIGNVYIQASDPFISDGVHQLVYEPLFYLNYETGKLEPWLATGFRYSKGNTVLTVNLRRGVRWNDGAPFTSKDVVFTMRQILATQPTPFRAGNIQASVRSARALDPYTVQFVLKNPNPRFIYTDLSVYIYTANFMPLPEHIFRGKDFKTFTFFNLKKGWPFGTGPYRVTSVSATRTVFTRSANWWAAKAGFRKPPAPARVIYTQPGPEDSVISQLVSNQYDYAGQSVPTPAGFRAARARNRQLINWNGDSGWNDPCPFSLTINTKVAPWNDPAMRRALNFALNKTQFSRLFNFPGPATPARTTFPEYGALKALLDRNRDLFQKYPTTVYSVARAASTFRSKGYTNQGGKWIGRDGKQLSVSVDLFSPAILGPTWGTAAQLVKQNFDAAGLAVNVTSGDWDHFFSTRGEGKFELTSWFECGSVTDPWATLNRYSNTPSADNPGGWTNARYNSIVARIGRLAPSDPRVRTLFRQALEIYLRERPVIALNQRPTVMVMNRTYWRNWPTAQNAYTYPAPWVMNFHQVILRLRPAR